MAFKSLLCKLALCAGLLGACAAVSQVAFVEVIFKPTHHNAGAHATPNHSSTSTAPTSSSTKLHV